MNNVGTSRSPWTHSICDECWSKRAKELIDVHSVASTDPLESKYNKVPYRVAREYKEFELCCWCRALHDSGIYVREDPKVLPCMGLHDSSIVKAVNDVTEAKAHDILRVILEDRESHSCLSQDEIDAIHYLITIRESQKGGK